MEDFLLRTVCFKHCPTCNVLWRQQSQFLSDPEVKFLGFRPAATPESLALIVFNHARCDTRLTFTLETFAELTVFPILCASCAITHKDTDYCLAGASGRPCPALCICAFVHNVSESIRAWPKCTSCAPTCAAGPG
jgi:hypothetical protein